MALTLCKLYIVTTKFNYFIAPLFHKKLFVGFENARCPTYEAQRHTYICSTSF